MAAFSEQKTLITSTNVGCILPLVISVVSIGYVYLIGDKDKDSKLIVIALIVSGLLWVFGKGFLWRKEKVRKASDYWIDNEYRKWFADRYRTGGWLAGLNGKDFQYTPETIREERQAVLTELKKFGDWQDTFVIRLLAKVISH